MVLGEAHLRRLLILSFLQGIIVSASGAEVLICTGHSQYIAGSHGVGLIINQQSNVMLPGSKIGTLYRVRSILDWCEFDRSRSLSRCFGQGYFERGVKSVFRIEYRNGETNTVRDGGVCSNAPDNIGWTEYDPSDASRNHEFEQAIISEIASSVAKELVGELLQCVSIHIHLNRRDCS
jgi:hypothetical protein